MSSTSLLFSLLASVAVFLAMNAANASGLAYDKPMCEPNPVVMTVLHIEKNVEIPFGVQAPCQNELNAQATTAPVMGEFSTANHAQYEPADVEGDDANMFAPKD